jgi:hypothetical protein
MAGCSEASCGGGVGGMGQKELKAVNLLAEFAEYVGYKVETEEICIV